MAGLDGLGALLEGLTGLVGVMQGEAAAAALEDEAGRVEEKIKALYGEPSIGPALAASTEEAKAKARAGYPAGSPRLATGAEHDAVTHTVTHDGETLVATIGIPSGDPTAPGALANEVGTATIPPRPIYQPVAMEEGQHLMDTAVSIVKGALPGGTP